MSINGKWNIRVRSPMGELDSTLTLESTGSTLTGTVELLGDSAEVTDGTIDGESLEWRSQIPTPMPDTQGDMMERIDATYTATVSGDSITGIMHLASLGNAAFSGNRA